MFEFFYNFVGPPRGFGDSGRRAIYFQGFGEKGYLFSGVWGESITFWGFREQGAEEKHFRELGRKVIFLSGSREQRPPPRPLLGGLTSKKEIVQALKRIEVLACIRTFV